METTLDLVKATNLSFESVRGVVSGWRSLLSSASTAPSDSEIVRRFSILKLSFFSNFLPSAESELFFAKTAFIDNLEPCRFKVNFDGSRLRFDGSRFKFDGSRFKFDGSRFKFDGSRFRFEGSRFKLDGSRFRFDGCRFKLDGSRFNVDLLIFELEPSRLTLVGGFFTLDVSRLTDDGSFLVLAGSFFVLFTFELLFVGIRGYTDDFFEVDCAVDSSTFLMVLRILPVADLLELALL